MFIHSHYSTCGGGLKSDEVPALRNKRLVRDFRRSLSKACERGNFRVVQYSIQRNHVHMIVEAKGK